MELYYLMLGELRWCRAELVLEWAYTGEVDPRLPMHHNSKKPRHEAILDTARVSEERKLVVIATCRGFLPPGACIEMVLSTACTLGSACEPVPSRYIAEIGITT